MFRSRRLGLWVAESIMSLSRFSPESRKSREFLPFRVALPRHRLSVGFRDFSAFDRSVWVSRCLGCCGPGLSARFPGVGFSSLFSVADPRGCGQPWEAGLFRGFYRRS